jgi:hypothetical protein
MTAQDHLSDTEVREVIAYLKTLSPSVMGRAAVVTVLPR